MKKYRVSFYNYNFRLKKMAWKYQYETTITDINDFADRAMAMEGLRKIEGIRIIDSDTKKVIFERKR